MKKEILEQAVLDYIGEKFKDKVLGKRVQTFFTYSELVDTVLSFAELLNKNIEELKIQNTNANLKGLEMQVAKDSHRDRANKTQEQLIKAKEIIRMVIDSYNHKERFSFEKDLIKAEQFLEEK